MVCDWPQNKVHCAATSKKMQMQSAVVVFAYLKPTRNNFQEPLCHISCIFSFLFRSELRKSFRVNQDEARNYIKAML